MQIRFAAIYVVLFVLLAYFTWDPPDVATTGREMTALTPVTAVLALWCCYKLVQSVVAAASSTPSVEVVGDRLVIRKTLWRSEVVDRHAIAAVGVKDAGALESREDGRLVVRTSDGRTLRSEIVEDPRHAAERLDGWLRSG